MCGIVGIWHRKSKVDVDVNLLQSARARIDHRGPDDTGEYVDTDFGLAHCRLSVLDTSRGGHQPMSIGNGRYHLVFNGEIYNYRQLVDTYLQDVELVSSSDTEVLAHLLQRKGIGALSLLKGMFSLAFRDREAERLILARDPFGKKPLFYAEHNGDFMFASETKALLGFVDAHVNQEAVTRYFLHEYIPSPDSAWEGITQLPMGHAMEVTREGKNITKWWKPDFAPKHVDSQSSLLERLDTHLQVAVERRLVSDVPVGLLLSGGLDSTTIGWYMSRLVDAPVRSYSVSFSSSEFDESLFAENAARSLAFDHEAILFDLEMFKRVLPKIVRLMDMPLADASLLPTYAICERARQDVTVVLDGDGSDELFGGYGTFQAALVAERLSHLPQWVLSFLSYATYQLPTRYGNFSFDFKAKSFVRGLGLQLARRNQVWLGSFSEAELRALLQDRWGQEIEHVWKCVDQAQDVASGLETVDAVSYATISHYMQDDILVKLDRASMFNGLEARTPFLDVDLAEFVMRLPVEYKRDKNILRTLMRGRIPQTIVDRNKQGFGIPLGMWLRGSLQGWMKDVLNQEKLDEDGIFRFDYVNNLIQKHVSGKADLRKQLWTLLSFQLWYDEWVAQRDLIFPD